ncbi:hypothetical protein CAUPRSCDRAFT_10968 [Caulochytrium protostelioides]|uniref:Uncharacterized protein n=1 Tax=Caulochytrium protostelioides TaxID=1555241 RepID=A0A4P9WYK3_9FUNG|nr:hypothetical protein CAUPRSCDRAFT_10968 [Caulochytrium protostelioides]
MRRKCSCPLKKFANYGLPTETGPTWCALCPDKPAEAETITSRRCPCAAKKCANVGLPADTQPIWCAQCPDRRLELTQVLALVCGECKLCLGDLTGAVAGGLGRRAPRGAAHDLAEFGRVGVAEAERHQDHTAVDQVAERRHDGRLVVAVLRSK